MKATWAVIAGLALGAGAAWWLSRPTPEARHASQVRARQAALDAVPALYRWRDRNGVLQISDRPPKGIRYERIALRPRDGVEVRGDRP